MPSGPNDGNGTAVLDSVGVADGGVENIVDMRWIVLDGDGDGVGDEGMVGDTGEALVCVVVEAGCWVFLEVVDG